MSSSAAEAQPAEADSSGKKAAAGKKKSKKDKADGAVVIPWNVALMDRLRTWRDWGIDGVTAVRSEDHATRRMSLLFSGSVLLLMASSIAAVYHGVHLYSSRKALIKATEEARMAQLGEFLKKQAEEFKIKAATFTLGTFTVELNPVEGEPAAPGVLNLAELEIVVECDKKDTREYLENHVPQVRDQVIHLLRYIDRDFFLSREGKKQIKKRLIEQINTWLPSGKVENLYFSKLLLN